MAWPIGNSGSCPGDALAPGLFPFGQLPVPPSFRYEAAAGQSPCSSEQKYPLRTPSAPNCLLTNIRLRSPPALLSAMARPRSAIDQHRDYVSRLYLSGVSRSRICYKLRKHFHVAVNLSTLSRRIADWDLPRQQTRTRETPELIETVRDLIFRVGLTEKQTISVLQRQGWPITKRGLKRIRLHPDRRWLRRLNSEEERLALLEKAEQAIIEMTQRSNAISGYGKNLLQPYLRQQMQLWVPRDPLFQMYKVMFPNEVELRKRMFRRKKGSS